MSKWQKGQSGNSAGKTKGLPDKRRLLREKIENHADELIELAITLARSDNSTALALLLSRAVAPARPEAATVAFERPDSTKPSDWARAVLGAIDVGRLAPDTSRQLIDAIKATQNIILIDEIAERIDALERGHNDDWLNLYALRERQIDAEPLAKAFIVMGEHGEPPDNGEPCRKTGESEAACLARYGIEPKQPAIFIRAIDASVPRPNDH